MKATSLSIYTVYKNPSDYKNKFVVRHFMNDIPERVPLIVADTLEEARKAIPDGMYRMDRQPDDDPVILEVWI